MLRRKEPKVLVDLTAHDLHAFIKGMVHFRNEVIKANGPTEDIDELLEKLEKKLRKIA